MKKITLFSVMAMFCLAGNVQAQEAPSYPESASTEVFDFTPWNEEKILDLFVAAAENGRKYPTTEEWSAAGFNLDLEFSRSHVRPRKIMEDPTKQLVKDVYSTRRLWMNIPTGQGQDVGGYPSAQFNSDVYSMWNYTNLFGSWNHQPFQAPGSWADAAHKNGTDIFSGIKFFESWTPGSTANDYIKLITKKNADGTYRYVDAFLNALMFFGLDGINYNWEDSGYSDPDVVKFHQALYKKAEEIGFANFHIGLYTQDSSLTSRNVDMYGNEDGKTTDVMLNYSGGNFATYSMGSSVKVAKEALGTADGLYAGVWISNMDRSWNKLNADADTKECGLCLWGEHKISRFFQFALGDNQTELQSNYQKLLEKGFSGGNRTPIDRPTPVNSGIIFEVSDETKKDLQMTNFCGLAEFVPERTAIQGDLPFNTHFTLGNGDRYNYKGKKTFGSWYNMAQQDVVPTYRWLVYQSNATVKSADIAVEYTHEDAYIGGSSLRLSGEPTTQGSDIVLYRTKLNVTGDNPVAKVALKSGVSGTNPSNLYVIVKKMDDNTWLESPVGDLAGATWGEKKVTLSGIGKGDVIEYIGFRVKGAYSGNYNMLVGKLELSDDRSGVIPASIDSKSIIAEVKEETTKSLSVKLTWEVDATNYTTARKDYGMIYNDEVNIDHFDILYKNGKDGRVAEIARTSTWSAYLGNIMFEGTEDDPYIGIRSVSVDLKTYSPIEWIHIERATGVLPAFNNDPYCESGLNYNAEGSEIAVIQRYIEQFKISGGIDNIDYTANAPQADGTQYALCNQTLKVEQGQKLELFFKAHDTSTDHPETENPDGLRFCLAKAYIDLNGSNSFEPADELIFQLGKVKGGTVEFETTGVTQEFTIPADARPGVSRLRVVFSDAWFAHPGPCGFTAKGFTLDIPVEITGNNPSRQPDPDMHDQGVADEPEGLAGGLPDGVENTFADKASSISKMWPTVVEDVINFENVDKAWIYTISGQLIKYIDNVPSSVNVSEIVPATYVVKMQKGQVVRSQKMFKK